MKAADVQRVAQKYVQPTRFAVLVGDRTVIEPGIKALNLGDITIMTIDVCSAQRGRSALR